MDIDRQTFLFGFVVGVTIAGGAGYILGRINVARNGMARPDNPMSVQTRDTPRQVMAAAAAAFRTCVFWSFMFMLFGAASLFALYWILFA